MSSNWNSVPIFFAIFTVMSSCMMNTTAEVQHVRFYNTSSSCNSVLNRTIHQSVNNINGSTFFSMSLLGMWQIWSCPSNNFNCGSVVTSYVINYNPTTPFCIGRVPNVLYNFRMMGDAYQTAPELYLYSTREFSGQVVKMTDSVSWTSSSPLSIQSFWFTGCHDWSLFSEASFKGSKTCLQPSPQVVSQGWGFSYNTTLVNGISIKSAKYGCSRGSKHSLLRQTFLFCSVLFSMKISFSE